MRLLGLLFAAVFITACATPEYQKLGANGVHRVGYEDQKLGNVMYRVRYVDKDSQSAYKNFLKRASQITLENGHSHFKVRDVGALKENNDQIHLSTGYAMDWSLNQYEATIVLLKTAESESFSAKEILATNPIPTKSQKEEKRTPAAKNNWP